MIPYDSFISNKRTTMPPSGFTVDRDSLHITLFEFQKDIVRWALRRGRPICRWRSTRSLTKCWDSKEGDK